METTTWSIEVVRDLPSDRDIRPLTIYVLTPKTPWGELRRSGVWHEQLKREFGIYTEEERLILSRDTVMLFLGAGGMGALMALLATRGHVGTIILSDPDTISLSNLNRQAQTHSGNIGKLKAFELARDMRKITSNTTIVAVPTGITPDLFELIAAHVGMPDIAFEEIELFEYEARVSTHIMLRNKGIPMINCNAIEFGSYLFLLTNEGAGLVEMLGYSEEAMGALLEGMRTGRATAKDTAELGARLLLFLIPEIREYSLDREKFSTVENWHAAIRERAVVVTGTTPATAAPIALLHGVQHVLAAKFGTGFNRKTLRHPIQPGYVYRDFLLPENDKTAHTAWFSFPPIKCVGHGS